MGRVSLGLLLGLGLLGLLLVVLLPPGGRGARPETSDAPADIAAPARTQARELAAHQALADPLLAGDRARPPTAALDAAGLDGELRDPTLVGVRDLLVRLRLLDELGAPRPGARATATTADGLLLGSAQAGAEGHIELPIQLRHVYPCETNRFVLELEAPGAARLAGQLWSGRGEPRLELGDLRLPAARRVHGRLVDEHGQPAAGLALTLKPRRTLSVRQSRSTASFATPEQTRVSDADGRVAFDAQGVLGQAHLALEAHALLSWTGDAFRPWDGTLPALVTDDCDLGDVMLRPLHDPAQTLVVRVLDARGLALPTARAARAPTAGRLAAPGAVLAPTRLELLEAAEDGARADETGTLRLPGAARSDAALAVAAPGFTPAHVPVGAAADSGLLEVRLEPEPALQLAFVDARSGLPVDGLTLQPSVGSRHRFDESPWISVQPGSQPGHWSIRDPARAELRLDVSAPGLGRRRLGIPADTERGPVLVQRLPGPRRLGLRVLDEAGAPRDDARVLLRSPPESPDLTRRTWVAQPQPEGQQRFVGLEPGPFELQLSAPNAPTRRLPIVIGDPAETHLGDLALPSYGELRLAVLDGLGQPAGVRPRLQFLGEGHARVPELEVLGPGSLHVTGLTPGAWRIEHEPGGLLEVEVLPGPNQARSLQLQQWARVEGRVLRDGLPVMARVLAVDGRRVEWAQRRVDGAIFALDGPVPPDTFLGVTDADAEGRFDLQLEQHDDVALLAFDALGNPSRLVRLVPRPGDHQAIDLLMPSADAVLEGRVVAEADGSPAAGALIVLDGVRVGTADAQGNFRIAGLQPRRSAVQAVPTPFQVRRLPLEVTLEAGATTRVVLELPADDASGYICF